MYGYILSGPVGAAANRIIYGDIRQRQQLTHEYDVLKNILKQFWETESIGIRECEDSSTPQQQKSFPKNNSYSSRITVKRYLYHVKKRK